MKPAQKGPSMLTQISWGKLAFLCVPLVLLIAFVSGCHKSKREIAEENAIKRHQQDVNGGTFSKQKFTNWALTKLPSTQLTTEAAKYLTDLNQKGELPGAGNTALMSAIGRDIPTNYPLSRTVDQMLKNGLVNHYMVTKDLPESTWQLQKAWRTDAKGNVVEQFPIK